MGRRPARHADGEPARRHVLDVPVHDGDVHGAGRAPGGQQAADPGRLAHLPAVPRRHREPLGALLRDPLPRSADVPRRAGRDVVYGQVVAGELRRGRGLSALVDRPDHDGGAGRVRLAPLHQGLRGAARALVRLRRGPGDAPAGRDDARLRHRRLRRRAPGRPLRRGALARLRARGAGARQGRRGAAGGPLFRPGAVHAKRGDVYRRRQRVPASADPARDRDGPLGAVRPPRAEADPPPVPV